MAGLSDMSMGEINRVTNNNDSMADYSMASLNDNSMAGVDDSGYKIPAVAGKTSTQPEDGNMLDGLKEELGMPGVSNP